MNYVIFCWSLIWSWQALSKLIGSDWKNIGRRLNLHEAVFDNLEADHQQQRERALQMFIEWMKAEGDDATYDVLSNALVKGGRADLAHQCLKS